MSSHKIRGIVAVAALTAGVSWLAAFPTMAETCANDQPAPPRSSCDAHSGTRVDDGGSGGSRTATSESTKPATAAGTMARQAGLTGLATVKTALGTADLGGIAANWGMPSLTHFPTPVGPAGMKDLATVNTVPALPALPPTPLEARVPGLASLGNGLRGQDRVAGSGIDSSLGLQKPVEEVSADVIGVLLPEVAERVESTSTLPVGDPVATGVGGLVQGLGLR